MGIRDYLLEKHIEEGYLLAGKLEHEGIELDIAVLDKKGRKQ